MTSENQEVGQEFLGLDLDLDTLKKAVAIITSAEVQAFLELLANMIESGNPTTRYQKAVLGCLITIIVLQVAAIVLLLQG